MTKPLPVTPTNAKDVELVKLVIHQVQNQILITEEAVVQKQEEAMHQEKKQLRKSLQKRM